MMTDRQIVHKACEIISTPLTPEYTCNALSIAETGDHYISTPLKEEYKQFYGFQENLPMENTHQEYFTEEELWLYISHREFRLLLLLNFLEGRKHI